LIDIRPSAPAATLDSPIEHLNACHRRIEARLDTLERAGPHLLSNTAEALTAIRSALRFFDSSGKHHTEDEEASFFPRMAGRLSPDEQLWVEQLENEHARAEALYSELKQHIDNLPDPPIEAAQARYIELAAALCTLYRQHIRNEDARFPSIAARHLSAADLEGISREMKRRRGL